MVLDQTERARWRRGAEAHRRETIELQPCQRLTGYELRINDAGTPTTAPSKAAPAAP